MRLSDYGRRVHSVSAFEGELPASERNAIECWIRTFNVQHWVNRTMVALLARLSRSSLGLHRLPISRGMASYHGNVPFVLAPSQLKDLNDSKSDVAVLDASWHMPNSPRKAQQEYIEKAIPGARYLDLDEVASPHELGLKHMMPTGELFAKTCGT